MVESDPPESESKSPQKDVDQWFRSSDTVRIGYARGNSFDMKRVQYADIDGMAIFEGDIALGTVEELERATRALADPDTIPLNGIAIVGERYRWPNGTVPYVIDSGLSNPQRVTESIDHWTAQTGLQFVARQESNPAHQNYLSFEELDGCWSQVGMRGGKQTISLGPGCSRGSAIHEIGHVVGLWHEHSRQDRDQFVDILWQNILEGREHNFNQRITDGDDIGAYDYASIMHYPSLAFSKNGQPTIVTKDGVPIGQRTGLSELDIAAVCAMYPGNGTGTNPTKPQTRIGSQVLGNIAAYDSRRWTTQDWPSEWNVIWSIVPSPVAARVEWNLVTERQSDTLLKYALEVRNLSDQEAMVEARYVVL